MRFALVYWRNFKKSDWHPDALRRVFLFFLTPARRIDQESERLYIWIMLVTIEVINDGALDLLSGMERLDLIRLNANAKSDAIPGKLSQRFAGALRLSETAYEKYQNSLREGRNEWRKDIC